MIYFPSNERALFLGKEQEGPSKGALTLFVVGHISLSVLHSQLISLSQERSVDQVYFGAGFLSQAEPEYLRMATALVAETVDSLITVEASYVDLRLCADEHINRWIYTAQMLDTVNPNYHHTMKMLTSRDLHKVMDVSASALNKIYVKVDFAKTTMVTKLSDLDYSKYEDYGDDKVLDSNTIAGVFERTVPYPQTMEIKRELETNKLKAFVSKVKAGPSFQLKVGWSPQHIFRSKK